MQRQAVILIDHGSRRADANDELREVAHRLADRLGVPVYPAHMTFVRPTLDDALDRAMADGHARVVVCPYFLGAGRHALEDIPRMAEESARTHPGIDLVVSSPLGVDDLLVELAAARVRPLLDGVEGA